MACVDCHLPPHGDGYLVEKVKTGARDVWGKWFKDPESFNWEAKSQIDHAKGHVFESSCIDCHQNNFPIGLTDKGREAHLYFEEMEGKVACINCHITVGHYDPDRAHAENVSFGQQSASDTIIYETPGIISGFSDFTEYIPGSSVSFEMKAIPGGTFTMGSPEDEAFREEDEGPRAEITISSFFMGKIEVTWDEYLVFFTQAGGEGKTSDAYQRVDASDKVDAISGPTPPYGAPDQGWGTGKMPAITMTHHAATVYCQWLSQLTGKTYRLPTEAEWEYAARGGTNTPYFFPGDPEAFLKGRSVRRRGRSDTTTINSYAWYRQNSAAKPGLPGTKWSNPYGLEHMAGNVAEFCSDWYAEDMYAAYTGSEVIDPKGPESGTEHVIRGGSFRDEASKLRSASREHTRWEAWMLTDPQIPKSLWWYSDCNHVGFRVVCEPEGLKNPE